MTICTRVPQRNCASYLAAKAMLNRPPLSPQEVFELADFGPVKTRMTKLMQSVRNGWLVELPGGRIIASEFAQEHFDTPVPVAPFRGSTATPRENLHAMEPLSRKHFLNVKGTRSDAPDCSIQAKPSHFAKVTP